jgi:hypothetical protein
MTTTPQLPPRITAAITQAEQQYRELEDKRDDADRAYSHLCHQLDILNAEIAELGHSRDAKTRQALSSKRDQAVMLAQRITVARNALDSIERDMSQVKLAHGQHVQAAREAMKPVNALDVNCPACGSVTKPWQTGPASRGHRRGEYDCQSCDTVFTATWSGGTDPGIVTQVN